MMNAFSDLLTGLLRLMLRLTLFVAGAIFVLSCLVAALLVVVGVSLWSLLTGRKPAPVVLFTRMRERSRRYASGPWGRADVTAGHEVVDVEATVVGAGGGMPHVLTPVDGRSSAR
jgi:hypothetical protein